MKWKSPHELLKLTSQISLLEQNLKGKMAGSRLYTEQDSEEPREDPATRWGGSQRKQFSDASKPRSKDIFLGQQKREP